MKKYALALLLLLGACSGKTDKKHIIDHSQKGHYLYVINSYSGSVKDKVLILDSVPLVVYFSDHPSRVAGHLPLKDFIAKWEKGSTSFKATPPTATLSIAEKGKMKEVSLELSEPGLRGDKLQFKIKVTPEELTEKFGASSLFIDLYGVDPTAPNAGIAMEENSSQASLDSL